MKKLIVLIPEGVYIDYYIYSTASRSLDSTSGAVLCDRKGRIRYRGPGINGNEIDNLIRQIQPEAIALKILYGGNEFQKVEIFDNSVIERLEKLVPQSPLDIPPAIQLIKRLQRVVPTPLLILFFETAFFTALPYRERIYAVADIENSCRTFDGVRRFGYHGIYHNAASKLVSHYDENARRILSICLESSPEVVGVFDGRPIMVSSGSTPLEGLTGNATCGEIDPGIVLTIEEKKAWGPEKINNVLTRESGLTALAGKHVTIEDVFSNSSEYGSARDFFSYRVLLYSGSAVAVMGGVDAIVFSGKYQARTLAEWLAEKLSQASINALLPQLFFLNKSDDRLIAEEAFRITKQSNR